jgi:hypothetical protein
MLKSSNIGFTQKLVAVICTNITRILLSEIGLADLYGATNGPLTVLGTDGNQPSIAMSATEYRIHLLWRWLI